MLTDEQLEHYAKLILAILEPDGSGAEDALEHAEFWGTKLTEGGIENGIYQENGD